MKNLMIWLSYIELLFPTRKISFCIILCFFCFKSNAQCPDLYFEITTVSCIGSTVNVTFSVATESPISLFLQYDEATSNNGAAVPYCISQPTGDQCFFLYDPVCGCNGKTYTNSDCAAKDGIYETTPGECDGTKLIQYDLYGANSGVESDIVFFYNFYECESTITLPAFYCIPNPSCSGDPLTYPWLENIVNSWDCSSCGIAVYQSSYLGQDVIEIQHINGCNGVDADVYDCDGNLLFSYGGNMNQEQLQFLNTGALLWDCSMQGPSCDRQRDSLALVDFYSNTGGATSWYNKWTFTQPMNNWYGVCLNNEGCVETLDLDGMPNCNYQISPGGNGLSGTLPDKIGNLRNLKNIYLTDNPLMVGTIPDTLFTIPFLKRISFDNTRFEGAISPNIQNLDSLTLVLIDNNLFTFEDFLHIVPFLETISHDYEPQAKVYPDETINRTVGETFSIDLAFDDTVTTNLYYWYKDGILLPGMPKMGDNTFSVTGLTLNDAGVYTCEISNPHAPELTLMTGNIELVVQSCTVPVAITPDPATTCPGQTIQLDAGPNFTQYQWSNGDNTRTISVSTGGVYTVTVTDGNGCTGTDFVEVLEADTEPPTVTCVNGISNSILPNQQAPILASDFVEFANDNCSTNLQFSFSSDPSDGLQTYDCSDVGSSFMLEIWATDEAGNQDFCSSIIQITDDLNYCNTSSPVDTLFITASNETAAAGNIFCMDFTVDNFTDILSLQYSMNFDPLVFQYESIQGYGLPGLSISNFNVNNVGDGYINVTWMDPVLAGVSLPDGSVIYQICFTSQCSANSTYILTFSDNPTPIEASTIGPPFATTIPLVPTPGSLQCGATCQLTASAQEVGGCNGNGEIFIEITVTEMGGGADFSVSDGVNNFGVFNYTQSPVQIGPFQGNGQTLELTISDLEVPTCSDMTNITLTDCQAPCTHPDKPALVAIYEATNGSGWTNIFWDTTSCDVCTWPGIGCNVNGRVENILLENNGLVGTLPSEIGDVEFLLELNLSRNQIAGVLPSEIGNLTNLRKLHLSNNLLTGGINSMIGSLTNLEELFLDNNQLDGSIPSEIESLINLVEFNCFKNKLKNNIPSEIGGLNNLRRLVLEENELVGNIPSTVGALSSLEYLSFAHNQLTGIIPDEFGALINLDTFLLNDNNLDSCIHNELQNLCNAGVVGDISNNPNLETQDWVAFCNNEEGICPIVNPCQISDDCPCIIDLGLAPYCNQQDIYSNIGATESDIGLNNFPPCFNGNPERDVWIQFTATTDFLDYTITISGTGNNPIVQPQIAIYRGDCVMNGLQHLDCASANIGENEISFDLIGLTGYITYYLRINDWSQNADPNWGEFNICIEEFGCSIPDTYLNDILCPEENLVVNGNIYDINNPTGMEILQTINGCDSTLNIDLNFFPPAEFNLMQTLCNGGSIAVNGNLYDENTPTGTEVIFGASINGCDSIININLSFNNQVEEIINPTLCPSENIIINGNIYDINNSSGTELFPNGSSLGCDSLVNVNLMFFDPAIFNIEETLCIGGNIIVNGINYDEDNPMGTDTIPGASANGCDSIIVVDLSFNNQIEETINTALCLSDNLIINGNVYDVNNPVGTELFPNGSSLGCDSLVNINLSFYDSAIFNLNQAICLGDSIVVNGKIYNGNNRTGKETISGASINGCDSIVYVDLTVINPSLEIIMASICEGETYNFNGNDLTNEDTYYDTLMSVNGSCDSIWQVLELSVEMVSNILANNDEHLFPINGNETLIPVTKNDSLPLNWDLILINNSTIAGNISIADNENIRYQLTDPDFIGIDSFKYEICQAACPDVCANATVYVVIDNDCITQTLNISPRGFSPNTSPGINDDFDPLGAAIENGCPIPMREEIVFMVINRWGEVVFKPDGYEAWSHDNDPQLNKLPAATYYYILNIPTPNGEPKYFRRPISIYDK